VGGLFCCCSLLKVAARLVVGVEDGVGVGFDSMDIDSILADIAANKFSNVVRSQPAYISIRIHRARSNITLEMNV
jgi:hypothetical protein